ncbi:MAG: response regulator transcription factor [Bryobacteraceae bacterium]|nr:response regulator transcription factor [Bryobacteraceae bacterium]MDW8376920.1 response regulator transcription factor [Bryobacterales bacterium]
MDLVGGEQQARKVNKILVVDASNQAELALQAASAEELGPIELGRITEVKELLPQLSESAWDLVIFEPGPGGLVALQLVQELRMARPKTSVLVYTSHPEEEMGFEALRLGAQGYLTKDQPPHELLRAVKRILAGRRYISEALAERLAESIEIRHEDRAQTLLSEREYQILRMLGTGMSPTEIATQLNLSIKTVSTYRTRVLQKLNLRTTAQIIRYAIEHKIC